MPDDTLEPLHRFCEANDIRRFEAEEILELLADGEDPAWIAGQATEDRPELAPALTALLTAIAPASGPQGAADDDGRQAPAVAPATEAGTALEVDELEAQLADVAQALPPGVDARQLRQVLASPRGQLLSDFGAFCQERGYEGSDEERLRAAHEEWLTTPRDSLEGKRPAEVLEGGRLFPEKVTTFRREQPKVGRNDPCPCGSGRKYKKCCGREA